MSAASRIPEELLYNIISYVLFVDEETFCAFPLYGWPRWRDRDRHWTPHPRQPLTNCLLVSKQWLRIGTPLLYEKVTLLKMSSTKAVAQLVKTNPAVGRSIRYLRLEGGMGKDLLTVVKHAPNIHTLWITPHVRASEGVAGLRKAISLLRPQKAYLMLRDVKHNKASKEAEKLILSSFTSWITLTSVTFYDHSHIDKPLSRALRKLPVLKEISMGIEFRWEFWIKAGFLPIIARNETLESITFYGHNAPIWRSSLIKVMEQHGMSDRAETLFRLVKREHKAAQAIHQFESDEETSDSESSDYSNHW